MAAVNFAVARAVSTDLWGTQDKAAPLAARVPAGITPTPNQLDKRSRRIAKPLH